ncbi:MAG: hypothetical protein KKD18_06580 [Nanoarchaeota archaeon]|nr:hypothetical protein [Nanoarchaeota archaeon]MBU0978059.1 hypothetical protein [Nanoarchaeota archaeon]
MEQKAKEPEKPKKEPYKPSSTDEKIEALLDFAHIEELFHTLNILKDKEIRTFLEHYKKSEISPTKDKRIDLLIRNSENQHKLRDNVRDEIVRSVENEIQDLKSRMSALTKKGKDTYVEMVKLLTAPLKIKIFKATGNKDDFYKIKKIISAIEEKIKPKEEELLKETKEKEILEKEKEERKKQEQELKEKIKKGEPINQKKEKFPDPHKPDVQQKKMEEKIE